MLSRANFSFSWSTCATRLVAAALAAVLIPAPASLLADANLTIEASNLPGDRIVSLRIMMDNEERVYGVQLSLTCDESVLRLLSLDLSLGVADGAEFSDGVASDDGGAISWGIVLDVSAPFDPSSYIPPGERRILAELEVEAMAHPEDRSTLVRFEDNPPNAATPVSINKVVRQQGIAVPLNTYDGEVTVLATVEPTFLRGDANNDLNFDLSDGVFTLNFLFTAGTDPQCLDAADANDNGQLDLSDAVYSFNNLFTGGPPPPEPHANVGPDPTADGLDCQNAAAG